MNFPTSTKLNSYNLSNISTFDVYTGTTISLEKFALKSLEKELNRFSTVEISEQENMENFVEGLYELAQDEYDEEFLAPTKYSYHSILRFLDGLSKSLSISLPIPNFISDGEGGIRATWEIDGRELRLVCPAKPNWKPYLYHEKDDSYDVEKDLEVGTFVKWFRWLING